MPTGSARFTLPHLQPGQAQKEVFHNEALTILDAALHPVAQEVGTDDPPAAPVAGAAWIVGSAPTGAWTGHADALAAWSAGGWRFVAPQPGMLVWAVTAGCWAVWDGSAWVVGDMPVGRVLVAGEQVVGPRQPAIAAPVAGTVIDAEARAAITGILDALAAHGLIHP